jgi:hypothetical protein
MKKTKRARTAKSRQKAHAAGKPGRPTHNRLQHIAEDVLKPDVCETAAGSRRLH